MNTHILCLNIFILLLTINPISIGQLVRVSFMGMGVMMDEEQMNKTMGIVFLILTSLVFVFIPLNGVLNIPQNKMWFLVAVLLAPVTIFLEIMIAKIFIKNHNDRKIEFVGLGATSKISNLCILLVGLLEEVIYRYVWFGVLQGLFGVNIILVIVITSLFYALNHISISNMVFVQKFMAGSIYGLLYLLSGSVLICIITHVLQNFIVLWYAHSKTII